MKRLLLILLFVLLACPFSWGTGQESDILVLDGEEWALLAAPLERLDSATYRQLRDAFGWESPSTGNWRGYVAYWSVSDGLLCLEKVVKYDEALIEEGDDLLVSETVTVECDYGMISRILERYVRQGKVCATWFSGKMIAGKGNVIRYVHMGFDRDYEEEIVISAAQGALSLSPVYHNLSGGGPQEKIRLESYLMAFPKEKYALKEGRYFFRFKYDPEACKWIARLYMPSSVKEKDALEKDLTDYINAFDGELRDYIRGEWSSSRIFTIPIDF